MFGKSICEEIKEENFTVHEKLDHMEGRNPSNKMFD